MRLKFEGTMEIDFEKEEERIRSIFDGEEKERQLKLIEFFKNGNFEDGGDFYHSLPYCLDDECPEQEFVGEWFHDLCNLFDLQFSYQDFSIKIVDDL
jgi:hypothetical protein